MLHLPLRSPLEPLQPFPDLVLVRKGFRFGEKVDANNCAQIPTEDYLSLILIIIIIL